MTTKLSPTERKILDFIAGSPACTTKDVAVHFKKSEAWAGPFISVLFNTKKVLDRTLNLENRGYRWYAAGMKPKFEKPASPEGAPSPFELRTIPKPNPPVAFKQSILDEAVVRQEERTKLGDLVNQFVDALADEVVSRLRPAIVERLSNEVKSMSKDIATKAVHNHAETKDLKRILVCGVLSKQGTEMQREFDGVADIRFVTVDDNASLWKSRATHADSVVLWTNFVSHKHQEALTGVGIKPILVTGGITAVKDKLMELSV